MPAQQSVRWLRPWQVWLPLPGWLSILQRVSGLLLILLFPPLVWLFGHSLQPHGWTDIVHWLYALPGRCALTLLVGVVALHSFGGLRLLLLDVGIGTRLPLARRLSWLVLGLTCAGMLWAVVGVS
ncbi:MAG: succinate dehydrogenase, cytochrome b556 subunit [Betaproteobacteria bacterium]|nr:succinate dehydrogenase, cytochrome b556 subunit [Betaproteobacteria bacterium]